jgi:DNA mismatch repair protein MutL
LTWPMGKIKALPPEVVSRIAAGEVVERPASVVKELIENSLDAGSREIKIEIQSGGKKLIRVIDDGEGMTPEDARSAIQRYSTSKIESAEDLFAIASFGFRGEALSSIASVSRLKIITRKDNTLGGVEINIEGGEPKESKEVGCPPGTLVEARDLFFNIPARLKFLKAQGTELSFIGELVAKIALANPQTQFQFLHDGKLLAHYPVREEFSSRLAGALGREAAEQLHFFEYKDGAVEIHGYAGEPGLTRSNARGIYLFVNRRPVHDRLLSHGVLEAYRHLIPKDRYPVTILFVEVHPSDVDVNVHPSKWEIKFVDSATVHRSVLVSIRRLLEKAPWVREKEEWKEGRESSEVYIPFRSEFADPFIQEPLGEEAWGGKGIISQISYLGQIDKTYLLFTSSEGLILVDQHAAHERILWERLWQEFSSATVHRQSLLFPEIVEFSFAEARAAAEHLSDLNKMGFEIMPSGGRTFWVKAVPEILASREPMQALKEMVGQISSWGKEVDLQSSFEALIKMMACRGAVPAFQNMNELEAVALWDDLQKCVSPSRCPHGRPTLLKITVADLEKMFGRK